MVAFLGRYNGQLELIYSPAFALLQHASWRWAYWLCCILDGGGLIGVFLFYRPVNQYIREEGKTRLQQLKSTDLVGILLWTAGLVLFLLGISFGGTRYPWRSGGTLVPIIVGIALLIVLGFWESYAKLKYPLFPPSLLKNLRGITSIIIGVFMLGAAYYSTAALWPQQALALYTQDDIKLGWYSSTLGLGGLAFGPVAGYMLQKVGHARVLLTTLIAILTIASGCQAIVGQYLYTYMFTHKLTYY